MSRPLKQGINYFPVQTNIFFNRKIQRLMLKHDAGRSFCIYLAMLSEIYTTTGYYVERSSNLFFNIGFMFKLTEEEVEEVIDTCVKVELFDARLLEEKNIYTSTGIQRRYREVSKRTLFALRDDYLTEEMVAIIAAKTPVSVAETAISVTETPVSATKTTPHININKNKNKNKNKNENQNMEGDGFFVQSELTTKIDENHGHHGSGADNGATARRAELQRMAAAATGKGNA